MEISSVSSAMTAAKAAESSILIAKKALDAQKLEGQAAVELIRQTRGSSGAATGNIIDIYA